MMQKKNLADFNLAVGRHTTKPPNFLVIQYIVGQKVPKTEVEVAALIHP